MPASQPATAPRWSSSAGRNKPWREVGVGAIRRRHIIYAEAYDPRGPKWYFDLFQRTCDRFQQLWPITLTLQPIEADSADFAHWRVDARGSNWQVTTHYDFLRPIAGKIRDLVRFPH